MKEIAIRFHNVNIMDGEVVGEADITTVGELYEKDGALYLQYNQAQDKSSEGQTIVLKLCDGKVEMSAVTEGQVMNTMTFGKDEKSTIAYNAQGMFLEMELTTQKIDIDFSYEDPSRIYVEYTLEFHSGQKIEYKLTIEKVGGCDER